MHDPGHSRSASFLVRFWWEPREERGEAPVLRGYLRSLQSGEEVYLNSPGEVAELISRHLHLEEGRGAQSADGLRSAASKSNRPADGTKD